MEDECNAFVPQSELQLVLLVVVVYSFAVLSATNLHDETFCFHFQS